MNLREVEKFLALGGPGDYRVIRPKDAVKLLRIARAALAWGQSDDGETGDEKKADALLDALHGVTDERTDDEECQRAFDASVDDEGRAT